MYVEGAIRDSLLLADPAAMPDRRGLSYPHLVDIVAQVTGGTMPYGRQCRWLGWFQCAVVATGSATLEGFKQINRRNALDRGVKITEKPELDVGAAMRLSFALASEGRLPSEGPLSFRHLAGMTDAVVAGTTSYGKRCRWLGWLQCAVVWAGCAELADMEQINRESFPATV